jgi:hypothetical protein
MKTANLPRIGSHEDAIRLATRHTTRTGKLAHNTRCVRTISGARVILHSTTILTFTWDGVRLNSGGYRTRTTQQRMNALIPTPWRIVQRDFAWYALNTATGEAHPYRDGMRLPYVSDPSQVPYYGQGVAL